MNNNIPLTESEAIDQIATRNINLNLDANPDNATAFADIASRENVPVQWVQRLDNRTLKQPVDASRFHPSFQHLLANSYDKVPMYVDDLPALNRTAKRSRWNRLDPSGRIWELKSELNGSGETPARRHRLFTHGYQLPMGDPEGVSGEFVKDGRAVSHPIFPDEIIGDQEKALIDKALETIKSKTGFSLDGEDFTALSESGQRRLAAGFAAHLEKENAVLRQLNYDYPTGWIKLSDEVIRRRLDLMSKDFGIDTSDINIERLRRGGLSEVDYMNATNVLGWRDIYKYATRMSPEELAAIDGDSPLDQQLAKINYLADQSLDLRGLNFAGQTANVVVNAIPFIADFALTGGVAAVGKGAARVGVMGAMRNTLRAGGFTGGFGAGVRALGTAQGWQALGKASGTLLAAEARRLPVFAPKIAAQSLNEWEAGPVYYLDEEGVQQVLPDQKVEELGNIIFRNALSTYIEHVSEGAGIMLPGIDVAAFIPAKFKNAAVKRFIGDISGDRVRRGVLLRAINDNIPLQGVFEEVGEEWISNALNRTVTVISEVTGAEAFNTGRKSVFGDAEENALIFTSSLILSTGGKALRAPFAAANVMKLNRFVDDHRALVDSISQNKITHRSVEQAKDFLTSARGGDVELAIDPEDAQVFFQSHPEFAGSIGITQDTIAQALDSGSLLRVSQNTLAVEQARSPQNLEAGEQLLGHVRQAGMTAAEAMDIDLGEEAIFLIEEQKERMKAYRDKAYLVVETAAQGAGVTKTAARNFAAIFGFMVNYLSNYSTSDAEIDAAVDKLIFQFLEDPGNFDKDMRTLDQAAAAAAALRRDDAPNDADKSGQLRDGRVPKTDGFMEQYNLRGKNLFADYEFLRGKHPEYLSDVETARAVVEFVLDNPEAAGTVGNNRAFVRVDESTGKYYRIEIEPKIRGNANHIRSAHEITAEQYQKIKAGNQGDATNAESPVLQPSLNPVRQSGEAQTGGKARTVSDFLRYNTAESENVKPDNLSQAARGQISFASDFIESYNAVITLFKGKADASTLPHESAHWLKRMMETLADKGLAEERMVSDLADINHWLDKQKYNSEAGTPEYLAEREEFFARGFEAFILTGRPPVSALEKAFRSLKKMLLAIYRQAAALGVELDDGITRVFEGILSTEELIERESPLAEAADALRGSFTGLLGISQQEAADFRRLIDKALAQSAEELDTAKQKMLRRLRTQWGKEAEAQMADMRVYNSWNNITAEGGLDYSFIANHPDYGKEIADYLYDKGLTGKKRGSGKDVPAFAIANNYNTVDELLTELVDAVSPAEFKADFIRRKEEAFQNDFEYTEAAMSTRATVETLEKLTGLLAEKGGVDGYRIRRNALRAEAERKIAAMSVRDILSDRKLIDDSGDRSKKMVALINKGDYLGAFNLAVKLRENLELLKLKADAKKEIAKIENLIKRSARMAKGNIAEDHQNAIKELAYFFGFSRRLPGTDSLARREVISPDEVAGFFGDIREWPDFLFRLDRSGYKDLTFAEFNDLNDFARYLYGEGRDLVKASKNSLTGRTEARLDSCLTELSAQPVKYHDRRQTSADKVKHMYRSFWTWGMKLWRPLKEAGKECHSLYSTLNYAVSDMLNLQQTAKAPCREAINHLHALTKDIDLKNLPEFNETVRLRQYDKWTPEMVVAAVLNMGNAVNRQRLKDGYGWSEADLANIASRLSAEAYGEIETIWRAIESLFNRVQQTFREENHYTMKRIQGQEFDVSTSDGQVITVQGGYYPLDYAYRDKKQHQDIGYTPTSMHLDASATHRRNEAAISPGPVSLSLLVPLEHIFEVSHYATHRMVLKEILGVVTSSEFKNAFGGTQSFERYHTVMTLIRNIAKPDPATRGVTNGFEAWGRSMLTGTALMLNIRSIMAQGVSTTVGTHELGEFYPKTVADFASPSLRREMTDMAKSKSAMIRDRMNFQDIDLASEVNRFSDSPANKARKTFEKIGYAGMRFMDMKVAVIAWNAAYEKAIDRMYRESVDPKQLPGHGDINLDHFRESLAVAEADDFVARTQGAARSVDLTPVQLTSIGRLFTPFITAANAAYNMAAHDITDKTRSPQEKVWGFALDLIIPSILQASNAFILGGGLNALIGDGDEDDLDSAKKDFIQELISSHFSGIPLVRDVADYGAGVIAGNLTGSSGFRFRTIFEAGSFRAINDVLLKSADATEALIARQDFDYALYLWSDAIGNSLRMPALKIYERSQRMLEKNNIEWLPDLKELTDDRKQ